MRQATVHEDEESWRKGRVLHPFCHIEFSEKRPKSRERNLPPQEIRTLGDRIRQRRLDLKLSQNQVAKQIGANVASLKKWEHNKLNVPPKFIDAVGLFVKSDPSRSLSSNG
jgi:DNA-binding transcriptional regulator YiaG